MRKKGQSVAGKVQSVRGKSEKCEGKNGRCRGEIGPSVKGKVQTEKCKV